MSTARRLGLRYVVDGYAQSGGQSGSSPPDDAYNFVMSTAAVDSPLLHNTHYRGRLQTQIPLRREKKVEVLGFGDDI
jgi:hypothetical protein